jgi:hypothetical protein
MMHRLAHLLHLNFCEGLIDHTNPLHDHDRPSTWRLGVRCITCGEERWFQ